MGARRKYLHLRLVINKYFNFKANLLYGITLKTKTYTSIRIFRSEKLTKRKIFYFAFCLLNFLIDIIIQFSSSFVIYYLHLITKLSQTLKVNSIKLVSTILFKF